jgi:hypothetical protein
MQRATSREQRDKSKKAKRIELSFRFSPLPTRSTIITILIALVLMLTACCAPAATSSTTLPETAFTATFLGFADDGQILLAKPEQSQDNVQLVYDQALTLSVGQRVYVMGRLEGNFVYVDELKTIK